MWTPDDPPCQAVVGHVSSLLSLGPGAWCLGPAAEVRRISSVNSSRSKFPIAAIMAPNLSRAQHEMLEGMIPAGLTNKSIAEQVGCSSRSVSRIRSNLRMFESTKAPPNRVGRRCKIDPLVQDALFDQLVKEPNMFRSEMIAFIRSEYEVDVSLSTITRLLQAAGWTRKNSSRVGEQQNPMLRDLYLYKLTTCKSFQLIFIDDLVRTGERLIDRVLGLERAHGPAE